MANLLIIKDLLKQKKISIRDFATELGMTEQALQLLIRKNSTKIETLELIAQKLNVSVATFFEENAENRGTKNVLFLKEVLEDAGEAIAKVIKEAVQEKEELIKAKNDTIASLKQNIELLEDKISYLESNIEKLTQDKKTDVHMEDDATCATAKESGLVG